MKKLALLTVLGLIASTQSFSQSRGGLGNQGGNSWNEGSYDRGSSRGHRQIGQQKIQIHINEHLRGMNTIKLKQEIKALNPNINLQNSKLVSVMVMAKSKRGHGKATLVVGRQVSRSHNIGGYPEDFHYNERYTFNKVQISNLGMGSQGKWQLDLQGNLKVKKVVVVIKKKQPQQRLVKISMYNQHLRGFNVLKIKQLIKQQNPGIDLQKNKIMEVTLVAKSKRGNGEATLITNSGFSYPETINGSPRAFESNAPRSFSKVTLVNESSSSMGKVQVELQGNIIVKDILVKLKKKRQGRGSVSRPTTPAPQPRRTRGQGRGRN
jgi:hypothetical protein